MSDLSDLKAELDRLKQIFRIRIEQKFPKKNADLATDNTLENATGIVRFKNWLYDLVIPGK